MVEYRIDDLARAAGTTVRNVRVYQDRDLLPPPRKEGRTAIYSDAHLTRLKLIISMLERGYAFAQIREMIGAWESGRSLGELLGLEEEVVSRSWMHDAPRAVPADELKANFGEQMTANVTKRVLELGLIERRGRGFVAPLPELYDAATELVALGIPLEEVVGIAESMQAKVDHLGAELAGLVADHVLPRAHTVGEATPFYGEVIERLRPLVFKALNSAAIRSADHYIPSIIGARMAELMSSEREASSVGKD